MPVNPYHDHSRVSLRCLHEKGDLDIVNSSKGKWNRGINQPAQLQRLSRILKLYMKEACIFFYKGTDQNAQAGQFLFVPLQKSPGFSR